MLPLPTIVSAEAVFLLQQAILFWFWDGARPASVNCKKYFSQVFYISRVKPNGFPCPHTCSLQWGEQMMRCCFHLMVMILARLLWLGLMFHPAKPRKSRRPSGPIFRKTTSKGLQGKRRIHIRGRWMRDGICSVHYFVAILTLGF